MKDNHIECITENFITEIRKIYNDDKVLLHRPIFQGKEKDYVNSTIDSNFVSSVGPVVRSFEKLIEDYTGANHAIATVNGTAALHLSILLAGVNPGDEVITQAVSFVATSNAISYASGRPIFLDVDLDSFSLSPDSLLDFLSKHCEKRDNGSFNKGTGCRIGACVPMHTFGFPARMHEIMEICKEWRIPVVEDAAESLGSVVRLGQNGNFEKKHTGTFGLLGVISFNGNKIITTGGGGMIITDDSKIAAEARFLSTTGKKDHKYEFFHECLAYNYRMPSLNAALGCAQMEYLDDIIDSKVKIHDIYRNFCNQNNISIRTALAHEIPNYWLNTIMLGSREQRNFFLEQTNNSKIQTRPLWNLLSDLPMYNKCQTDELKNSRNIYDKIVCLPSSARFH